MYRQTEFGYQQKAHGKHRYCAIQVTVAHQTIHSTQVDGRLQQLAELDVSHVEEQARQCREKQQGNENPSRRDGVGTVLEVVVSDGQLVWGDNRLVKHCVGHFVYGVYRVDGDDNRLRLVRGRGVFPLPEWKCEGVLYVASLLSHSIQYWVI